MGSAVDPAKLCDLYLRRSTLQDDKTTLRAHERDLRERAGREGLTVRKVWTDEVSAFKAGVVRENFDGAVAAVLAGEVRHLLVWKLDRLSRKGMGQVGQVLDQFDAKGARLVAHMDGLDSSVPQHRGLFAWLAEQARSESYNTSTRTRRTKAEKRLTGAWPGGQPPYGLRVRKGRTEHHPKEYPTSRRIADELLGGVPAQAVAYRLNADGLRTRRGCLWRSSTITQLAHSPAWAGLMPMGERYTDRGGRERWRPADEPLMGPDGSPVRVGKGVVTPGERTRVLAALRSRSSDSLDKGRRGKPQAQSLLSGVLKCGRCGGNMTKAGRSYRCYRRVNLGTNACLGMSVSVQDADAVISVAFLGRVASLTRENQVLQALGQRWLAYQDPEAETRRVELTAAEDEAQSRLNALDDAFYVQGRFKGPTGTHRYEDMRGAIVRQLAGVTKELRTLSRSMDLSALREPDRLVSAWRSADLEQARALLRVVLHSVTILPPAGQGVGRTRFVLLCDSCFHWVGEREQPHRRDVERLNGVHWFDFDGAVPLALAA